MLSFLPPAGGTLATAAWFLLTLQLFYFSLTLCSVPYEVLLPELAGTGRERVSISSLRVAVGVTGAALGLAGSGVLIHFLVFGGIAAALALLALATRYAGLAGAWRRSAAIQPEPGPSLGAALRAALTNRDYLILMPSWILFQLALGMLIGLLPYHANAVLNKDDEELWSALLTAVAIGIMALTLPLFVWLSRRSSPGQAYARAMLAAALLFPLLALPGLLPGLPVTATALVALALAGVPVAAVYLFPGPLIADIADVDRGRTGAREATFYGGQTAVDKTVGPLAPLLLGLILLLGNTASDPLGVRLVAPAASLLVLVAYFIFRRFDLPARESAPA